MKKVMAFGTFDVLHLGHEHYLEKAKSHGDYLIVVVARDETVEKVKGRNPVLDEERRRLAVESLSHVDVAVLGYPDEKHKIIKEYEPDIICLGYDQMSFVAGLEDLGVEIIRIDAFEPEKYKSSKIN